MVENLVSFYLADNLSLSYLPNKQAALFIRPGHSLDGLAFNIPHHESALTRHHDHAFSQSTNGELLYQYTHRRKKKKHPK